MKRKNKSLLMKAFSIICEDEDLTTIRRSLKSLIGSRADLTPKEKNALFNRFVYLYNLHDYEYLANDFTVKDTMHLMSTIERRADSRNKTKALKSTMRDNRAKAGLPVVFYLCSYHEKPATGHKEYQGKIYVDRYWKTTMESRSDLAWLSDPIRAYIRNHDVLTMQEVTSGEPYLVTRPYCKHFFVPLNTWDVLTSSLSSIKADHPEAIQGTGNKSKRQYRKEFIQTKKRFIQTIKEKASALQH